MKKCVDLLIKIGLLIILVYFVAACKSSIDVNGLTTEKLAPISIIGLCLGLYELIVRFWPTVANYSIVAFAIKVLKALSDLLNNQKK